ncbi:MAG: hypothetical protein JWP54_2813 [Cryobacterium sp.]|nr:hypothetical protein [Cryobacterium sp.]
MTAAATALPVCLVLFLAATGTAWLLSLLTRDYSWVDRSWSLLPPAYLWVFAVAGALADPRLIVMAALGTLWGARLTFNLARKGGYRPGGQDYRWAVLRRRLSRRQFALFNLFFISIYQNLLLLLITLPAWIALRHPRRPVPVLPAPELLLRDRAVVGDRGVRHDRRGHRPATRQPGCAAADAAVCGLDRLHREHLNGATSGLCRLPTGGLATGALAAQADAGARAGLQRAV